MKRTAVLPAVSAASRSESCRASQRARFAVNHPNAYSCGLSTANLNGSGVADDVLNHARIPGRWAKLCGCRLLNAAILLTPHQQPSPAARPAAGDAGEAFSALLGDELNATAAAGAAVQAPAIPLAAAGLSASGVSEGGNDAGANETGVPASSATSALAFSEQFLVGDPAALAFAAGGPVVGSANAVPDAAAATLIQPLLKANAAPGVPVAGSQAVGVVTDEAEPMTTEPAAQAASATSSPALAIAVTSSSPSPPSPTGHAAPQPPALAPAGTDIRPGEIPTPQDTSGNVAKGTPGPQAAVQPIPATSGQPAPATPVAVVTPAPVVNAPDAKPDFTSPVATQIAHTPDVAAGATPSAGDSPRGAAVPPQLQSAPAATIQIYNRIIERADGRAQRFEVRLDPAELGRVDVRIEIGADRKVHAVLAAHDSAALSDLVRGQRALERALSDAGIDLADNGVRFELARDNGGAASQQRESDGRPPQHNVWRRFETMTLPATEETAVAAQPMWHPQRLDLVA